MLTAAILFALLQQPAQAQQAGGQSGIRIVLTPATPNVVAGDSLRLRAQAVDASGKPVPGAAIHFLGPEMSMEGAVDSTGLVLGGAPGKLPVTVTAIVPGSKPVVKQFTLQVVPGAAVRVELAPRAAKLIAGQRATVGATVYSAAGDVRSDRVAWSSSAPNVVRAGDGGVLAAVGRGTATVTATAGAAKASMQVTVVPANIGSVEITPATTQARQGDVIRFKAVVRDKAGQEITGLTPLWSVSPGNGQIGADGAFVGYEPGTYTVVASFGPVLRTASVSLAERDVRRKATVVGKAIRSGFLTTEVWVHPNGKVAYLGTLGDRFYTIDISNPANPVVADSVMANMRLVNDIMSSADGKVLVFTREEADNRKNGIVIASLDDPLHPKVVSEFTDGVTAGVHSAFVATQPKYGTHVYLTNDGTGTIHVVDINDPAHPKNVATWRTEHSDAGRYVHDIAVQDGLLYASYWNDGLVILDVGNGVKGGTPSSPKLVSQYKYNFDKLYRQVEIASGPGFIRGTHTAWRYKNYVFVGDEVFGLDALEAVLSGRPARAYGQLHVVDVSDIEHPKEVAWYEPEYGGVHNVWVQGDTLYMGAYNAGFRAFDVSGELRGDLRAQGREIAHVAPSDPNGRVPNAPMTWGVVVKNDLAFVNDMDSGLWIVRLEPKTSVVP